MKVLNKIPTLNYIVNNYPGVDTVLFDMDGTLIDAEPIHMQATSKIIGDAINYNKLCEMGVGKTDDIFLKEIQALGYIENINYETFSATKLSYMIELIKTDLVLEFSMHSLIKGIVGKRIKLGLVTSSERDLTEYIFKHLDLNQYFDLIITRNDVAKPKPNPHPYLKAMTSLQSRPSQTLIFEDSDTGLKAATESGAHVIKVEWFE